MKTLNRLFAPLVFCLLIRPVAAADLAPSWTCVPDSTVLVARAEFAKFLEALRRQTKFGAVVLSEDRVSRGFDLWKSEDKAEWEKFSEELGKQGLKTEDLGQLFAGEIGYALTIEQRGERDPLFVGLAWLEPGEDLAERLVKAIQSGVEEQADEPNPTRRVDLELAGQQVMHLTIPVMHAENLDADEFAPDEFDDDDDKPSSPEALEKRREKLIEKLKNRKQVEADRVHVFIARLGGRLVLAHTYSQSSKEVLGKDEDEHGKIDWDELTGVEETTGVFSRFLEAHAGQGAGRSTELLNTPGLSATLPEGAPLLEIIGDPRPLILAFTLHQRMANKEAGAAAGEDQISKTLGGLGLDTLGAVAYRAALDGTTLRSGLFVSAPAPRQGILGLLDQEPLEPAAPQWVPVNVQDFQQISFDLGEAYSKIKELTISLAGDQVRQGFQQIEAPLQGLLQTDLATLLSSIGRQHSVIQFPPKGGDANQPGEARFTERVGLVWQVKDEQLWQRVMQTLGNFAGAAGGAVKPAEEQGFNGYRLQQGPIAGGLFLGRGYLVLGVGEEVTESLLSTLRNPPEGEAAMRTSSLAERAASLLPKAPCLAFQLSDAGQSVKTTKRTIENLIDLPSTQRAALAQLPGAPVPAGDSAASAAFAAKLKALLPSDEELEGVLGVSVGQTTVNEHGLSSQSALELPAP